MVNIQHKMKAEVFKPGHQLHKKEVFVEWTKVSPEGKSILVVTDADEPFEYYEVEAHHVLHTLSKKEKRNSYIIYAVLAVFYVSAAAVAFYWMSPK